LNERILKVDKNAWLNLIGTMPDDEDYTKWSSQDLSSYLMKEMHYFFVPRRNNMHHLYSFWIVADFNSLSGRQLLREAIGYVVCV
jgi:UDP-glucose:glycoprotein glucosyltransferase